MTLLIIGFFIIVVIGVGVLYFKSLTGFIDFFMLCGSEKIPAWGIFTMWVVANRNKGRNDLNEIFENSDFLNRCIFDVTQQKNSYPENSKRWGDYVNLLDILYEIRQNVAMKLQSSTAVSSSVDLPEDSILSLGVSGLGGMVYHSKILSNDSSGMIISYPTGPKLPMNFTWRGKRSLVSLSVGGISFRFAMTFDEDYWDQSFSTVRLLHSDAFSKEQKRSDIRYNVHIPATFILLESGISKNYRDTIEDLEEGNEIAAFGEFQQLEQRSVVKDLSLGGCRILVGGVVGSNLRCQLMLRLNGEHLPIQGLTRIVDYIESDDFSYVRIQFTHIERIDLQKICSFIYGIEVADEDIPPTPQENSRFYEAYTEGMIGTAELGESGMVPEEQGESEEFAQLEHLADQHPQAVGAVALGSSGETVAQNESVEGSGEPDEQLSSMLKELYETYVAPEDEAHLEVLEQSPEVRPESPVSVQEGVGEEK